MKKIKLVVVNEHTIGYIFPEYPNTAHSLRASILKGANPSILGESFSLHNEDTVRLASEKDFNEYRVVFDGYKKNKDEYEFSC